jgi:hypothetical protein
MGENYLQRSAVVNPGQEATAAWANSLIEDIGHLITRVNGAVNPNGTIDSSKILSLEAAKLTGGGFPFMIHAGVYPISSDGGPNTPFGLGGPNNYWTYLSSVNLSRFVTQSGVVIPSSMAGKQLILPFGALVDGSTVAIAGSVHFTNYVAPTPNTLGSYGAVATVPHTNMAAPGVPGYSFLTYVVIAV